MFNKNKSKNDKAGATIVQLNPDTKTDENIEDAVDVNEVVQDQVNEQEQTQGEVKNPPKADKLKFNVELQILRLGRNESIQMDSVEAATIEEAYELAVAERSKKLKEGYSCKPTGRFSKEEL